MKTAFSLRLSLTFLLFCTVSHASTPDEARAWVLKNFKDPAARKAHNAYSSLQKGEFSAARVLAARIPRSGLFSEYGTLITGLAWLEEAREAIEKKQKPAARAHAQKAIQALEKVSSFRPSSPWIERVEEEIGLAEILIGDSSTSTTERLTHYVRGMERLVTQKRLGRVHPDSIQTFANLCVNAKRGALTCPIWLQVLSRTFPPNTAEAKALRAGLGGKAIPSPLSTRPSSRLNAVYPNPDSDKELYRLASEDLFSGKKSDARERFEILLKDQPRSALRFRARYWLSEIVSKPEPLLEENLKETPLSWIGLVSALKLGKLPFLAATKPSPQFSNALLTAAHSKTSGAQLGLAASDFEAMRRAQHFLAEGARLLAAQELSQIRAGSSLSSELLFYLCLLADEAGAHRTVFFLMSELIQRQDPLVNTPEGKEFIFPIAYFGAIEAAAKAQNLDPLLVLSLVKQESAFYSRAMSSAGALGLMQVMPATASETMPSAIRNELTLPEKSLAIGARYLRQMMDRFDQNTALALAAYNAGPGAVNRWIREGRTKNGLIEFVERIPFNETRDYVGSILRNYYWYSHRMEKPIPKSLEQFWGKPQTPKPTESPSPEDGETTPQESSGESPDST